jgi:hypothetical protein
MTTEKPLVSAPQDRLISAAEAARMGDTTVKNILVAAAERKVEVLFECPAAPSLVLCASNPNLHDESSIGISHPLRTPDFLALEPGLCRGMIQKTEIRVVNAVYGYRMEPGRPPQPLYAADADNAPLFPIQVAGKDSPPPPHIKWNRWATWTFWADHAPAFVPVHHRDLLLRISNFYCLMGWKTDREPDSSYFVRMYSGEKKEAAVSDDFKSRQLLWMGQAAFELWGDEEVLPDDPSTHPSNARVIAWLMATGDDFTETAARNAASLIKPAFANRAGAPEKKK